jgi:hypothetical protein
MEYGMYAKISSSELITLAREKGLSTLPVKNLHAYSFFNRQLAKATKYIVLTTDPVAKRREVLLHLIRVVEVRHGHLPFHPASDHYSTATEMPGAAQLRRGALPDGWDHIAMPRQARLHMAGS